MAITTKTSFDDINEYDFADVIPTKKQETKVATVAQEIIASHPSQKKTPPPLSDKTIISNTTSSFTPGNFSPTLSPMSIDITNVDKNTTQLDSPTSNDDTSCLSQVFKCLTSCADRTFNHNRTYDGRY